MFKRYLSSSVLLESLGKKLAYVNRSSYFQFEIDSAPIKQG